MNLRLVAMPTSEEILKTKRRRAWWIASARRSDPRKPKLEAVARAVGLKPNSASTISDWENNIGGGPSMAQLELLAGYYGLPLSVFTEPEETEQERLDRLRWLARDAIDLAREDLAAEEQLRPEDEARTGESPGRRSA